MVTVSTTLGLLVGAMSGAAVGFTTTEKRGPATPHALPATFPDARSRYLKGVTASFVADGWLKGSNKWICEKVTDSPPSTGAKNRLECTDSGSAKYDVRVIIEYDDDTHVRLISADCDFGPGSRYCTTLFASMAHTVLYNQPELAKRASDWGLAHADADTSTVIDGIKLSVRLQPHEITARPAG